MTVYITHEDADKSKEYVAKVGRRVFTFHTIPSELSNDVWSNITLHIIKTWNKQNIQITWSL